MASTCAAAAAAAAKLLQSCPTLCDPIDSSPPGSPYPWDSPGKSTGVGCHCLLLIRLVLHLSKPVTLNQCQGIQQARFKISLPNT